MGPVIGSVVGVQKYIYDVFGPAVIEGSALCQAADPMQIMTSSEFGEKIKEGLQINPAGSVRISATENVEAVTIAPAVEGAQG